MVLVSFGVTAALLVMHATEGEVASPYYLPRLVMYACIAAVKLVAVAYFVKTRQKNKGLAIVLGLLGVANAVIALVKAANRPSVTWRKQTKMEDEQLAYHLAQEDKESVTFDYDAWKAFGGLSYHTDNFVQASNGDTYRPIVGVQWVIANGVFVSLAVAEFGLAVMRARSEILSVLSQLFTVVA